MVSGPHSQNPGKWGGRQGTVWLRPSFSPEPALRGPYNPALGETEPPPERTITETPPEMRDLVRVLGPVAVVDLLELELGTRPGYDRAELERQVHRRYHGSWRFWGPG